MLMRNLDDVFSLFCLVVIPAAFQQEALQVIIRTQTKGS